MSNGSSSNPARIELLLAELGGEDGQRRQSARGELVAMGAAAVGALVSALDAAQRRTRWEATKALAEIRDPAAVPGLVRSLGDDESDVRWVAAEGLIDLKRSGVEALLAALIDRSHSSGLRQGAHHVFKELAQGELEKTLQPVVAALEEVASQEGAPVAAKAALKELRGKS